MGKYVVKKTNTKWKLGRAFLIALTLMAISFVTVYADENDQIPDGTLLMVGEQEIVHADYGEIEISEDLPEGMAVSYDEKTETCILTLTDCTFRTMGGNQQHDAYIYSRAKLHLILNGSNVLTGARDYDMDGIMCEDTLQISGGGSLLIDMSNVTVSYGIEAQKQLEINGSELTVSTKGYLFGLSLMKDQNYEDGNRDCHIRIVDSKVILTNADCKRDSSSTGINAYDADCIIENSTVQITLGGKSSHGISTGVLDNSTANHWGGTLAIDNRSLVTIKLLYAGPSTVSLYYYFDKINSPYIYIGFAGSGAKLVDKSDVPDHPYYFEKVSTKPFLELAPTPQEHDVPVIPGGDEKKDNPMTVKTNKVTAKANKNTIIKSAKAFTVKNKTGKVTFKKISTNKKISISKAGRVTVKKGLKKGKTYTIKVLVTDSGNEQYKAGSKTVRLKVKIK